MDENKKFFTAKEVAKYLGLHEMTICRARMAGLIEGVKVSRKCIRYTKEQVEAYLLKIKEKYQGY